MRRTFLLEIVMIAVAVAFLFPVYTLVALSLKDPAQISQTPLALPAPPTLDNFASAWTAAALGPSLMNSTVITVASLIALIALGSFAAYYLARVKSGSATACTSCSCWASCCRSSSA